MSRWLPLPPLSPGDFAPDFTLATRHNPAFRFGTVAGRSVLLAFMPSAPSARAAALAALQPRLTSFDGETLAAFFVAREPMSDSTTADRRPGIRWFFDPDGEVWRRYEALGDDGGERPRWILLDRALRVLATSPIDEPGPIIEGMDAILRAGDAPDPPPSAPALIVPRIFEPDLCRRLIDLYESQGGFESGVMREVDGKTVGVLDPMKSRRDANIDDPELRRELVVKLTDRLRPQIRRAYNFHATRIERYIVARYDAEEGGYFRPHRDNTTKGTAHRRFAVSINLNAEEFEGGDLRFPEFGQRTYRPPTGGAVVFCCSMLHEATPVTRGARYAFLPFLYDDEGARIRQENLAFLDTTPSSVRDLR